MSRASGFPDVEDIVNNIDAHLKALSRSRAMLQTGTDRGGELTIYRRGSDIVRIDATIGGSNSDLQDVFYYSDANVVFVRSRMVTYPYSPTSRGFDFGNPRVKTKADYYVRDSKLIPTGHVKVRPSEASRLLREGKFFVTAIRAGNQVIDIEGLLK
jgi:hypothetical protein